MNTNESKMECEGDTVDRVRRQSQSFKRLLEDRGVVQLQKKFKPNGLTFLTGDLNMSEPEEEESHDSTLCNMSPKKLEYLREAKRQPLNSVTAEKYFLKRLVFNFGLATALKCRLGFCDQTGVWRILLMKPNAGCKPSIISIAYAEVGELIEKLENVLKQIEEGIKKGEPHLKPPENLLGAEWRVERPDNIQFWQKDVIYLSSGRLRMRVQWTFGDFYAIYLNNPSDNSMYEKYFGPKIRLGIRECQDFIGIMKEIISRCPPYSQMVEFADQE